MSKSKEQIKTILCSDDDRDLNKLGGPNRLTHLQVRQYLDILDGDNERTCTFDWYDAQAFNDKHLEYYVYSFVGSIERLMNPPDAFCVQQKANVYYFTKCGKCDYIILTNRDIGNRLVCMNPQIRCGYNNHAKPLSNDSFMTDVLQLVNEHLN
ncbi:unnamed protein product [Adineta steineri]|uniref:Uncharacterized protein n=1 Tax=Adineta steineri TaxID=433720 RepID=A0A816C279_9BILA|nr:unnamed protein product [Adineta steineri]CAF1617397.1 unnamed protein product [Adineta steineri]